MTGSSQKTLGLNRKIEPNASVVLREESDDWAILYDPDSDDSFGGIFFPGGIFCRGRNAGYPTPPAQIRT